MEQEEKDRELMLSVSEAEPLYERGLDPAEWFTTRTLANYWGVSRGSIRAGATTGKISWVKIGGRAYFNKATMMVSWRPRSVRIRNELAFGRRPAGRGIELLAQVEESYLAALAETVTYEDWVSIVSKAVDQAIEGNRYARKWIADYLLGTPVHRVAAEVDLGSKGRYSDDQRAAALTALLELVKSRKEDEVIDVEGTPVGDTVVVGESTS